MVLGEINPHGTTVNMSIIGDSGPSLVGQSSKKTSQLIIEEIKINDIDLGNIGKVTTDIGSLTEERNGKMGCIITYDW